MDAMPLLQPPTASAFDAISSILSAAVYMIVALAALARAPHDARVRVFVAIAATGLTPYLMNAVIWRQGTEAVLSKAFVLALVLSLAVGSLALLHFAQVFPWRRPWIRAHATWLWSGYAVVVVATAAIAFFTPSFDLSAADAGLGSLGALAPELLIAAAVLALAATLLFGVVIPFAGLLSLYKSFLTARAHGVQNARLTILWMLISQMGGGVLSILIIPLLRIVAPNGPWGTIAATSLFACSLLMPLSFAAGIWGYGVLDLPVEALPR